MWNKSTQPDKTFLSLSIGQISHCGTLKKGSLAREKILPSSSAGERVNGGGKEGGKVHSSAAPLSFAAVRRTRARARARECGRIKGADGTRTRSTCSTWDALRRRDTDTTGRIPTDGVSSRVSRRWHLRVISPQPVAAIASVPFDRKWRKQALLLIEILLIGGGFDEEKKSYK